MSDELIELEEEEHTSALTTTILNRILSLLRPHWQWVVGFIITIAFTSALDSMFTYINKDIIDLAIVGISIPALWRLATIYGVLQIIQSGMVVTFICLANVLCERRQYDLWRSMLEHLQKLAI